MNSKQIQDEEETEKCVICGFDYKAQNFDHINVIKTDSMEIRKIFHLIKTKVQMFDRESVSNSPGPKKTLKILKIQH